MRNEKILEIVRGMNKRLPEEADGLANVDVGWWRDACKKLEAAASDKGNCGQIDNTSYYRLPDGRQLEDFIWDRGLSFAEGSAVKYLYRAGHKDGESREKDVAKARHYARFVAARELDAEDNVWGRIVGLVEAARSFRQAAGRPPFSKVLGKFLSSGPMWACVSLLVAIVALGVACNFPWSAVPAVAACLFWLGAEWRLARRRAAPGLL